MKSSRKKLSVITTIIVALAVALAATWLVADDGGKQEFLETFIHEEPSDDMQRRHIDWEALPPEVIAWVEVPRTRIDEPIVQATPDAPNAYLYKDALGQGAYGTPYIDCECSLDSPFVMIYGHHMSDGSVFADFASFSDRAFTEEHSAIYVYTREDAKRHDFKVRAVDIVNADFELAATHFNSDSDSAVYLEKIIRNSDLVFGEALLENECIWGFVTCSYQTNNSRTVVYASAEKIAM